MQWKVEEENGQRRWEILWAHGSLMSELEWERRRRRRTREGRRGLQHGWN